MCKAVKEMIEERDSACRAVKEMIEERDSACRAVKEMIEERDNAVKARDNAVNEAVSEAVSSIISVMKKGNMSADDAMAFMDIPAEKREIYKSRILGS